MARKTKELPRLGKLPPQYKFFLNPYKDVRFTTSCPGCAGKTKQRKLPLAIHVDDWGMVILNKTCRLCPYCDLLIAHQDEIESHLTELFTQIAPQSVGNDYLIIGCVERKHWRRGLTDPLTSAEMIEALHDFEDRVQFKPAPIWEHRGKPTRPK